MGYALGLLAGDGGNIITKYIIILFGENYTSVEKRTENALRQPPLRIIIIIAIYIL